MSEESNPQPNPVPAASSNVTPKPRLPIAFGDRGVFVLSVREKYLCDAIIAAAGSLPHAVRLYNAKFPKRPLTPQVAKKWLLKRSVVKEYLTSRINEKAIFHSITKEQYFAQTIQWVHDDKKMNKTTFALWKLAGELKEFIGHNASGQQTHVEINFLQKDGNK